MAAPEATGGWIDVFNFEGSVGDVNGPHDQSGSHHDSRFGRIRLLPMATLAASLMIAGLVPVLATAAPAAASPTTPPQGPLAGSAHYGARHAPRSVTPHTHGPAHLAKGKADPHGQAPPSMGSGHATSGRPPVRSDNPTAGRAQGPASTSGPATNSMNTASPTVGPAGVNNANGNWENQLAFTGATLANTGCCQPPDTQMAVGTDYVFEAVNNSGLIFDRGGNLSLNFPMTDLFQPSGQNVGLTDPKVLFDPSAGTNGRFYLIMMVCQDAGCGANNWSHMGISIAVSDDDNPFGTWFVYDYLNDGQDLQDQPKLGFSADKVTIAVNEYGCKCGAGNQFKQENIIVLQKSDLVAANTITPVIDSQNSYSSFIFDSIPTTPVNASTFDNTQYVVWNAELSSDNKMGVIRITGTPNGGDVDFSNVQTPAIANTTAPPTPIQPGTCFDSSGNPIACTIAGDKTNFQSVVVQGSDLWAVGTDGCTPQDDNTTRDCTRLTQVDLSNGGASVVFETDVGTQGTYRYNPAVMRDVFGNLFFGFTISSSTLYATAAVDASPLPLPPVLSRINYASGDATYTGTRWGDYSGLAQDPRDPGDVWAAEEFGACVTACSSGSGNWATAIGQFTFDNPHIYSVSPSSGPATGGTTVDIYGDDFAGGVTGGTSVSFGGTPAQSVTFLTARHIRAVSPAAGSGTVDITATTLNGSSEIVAGDRFAYFPVVTSVSPRSGPSAGGQTVTISGAGFIGTTTVSFGGTPASSFTVNNGGSITAVTPAHAPGTVDVTVTANGQTSPTSSADLYTFQFPTTTSLASSANPSIVGASVTYTATVSPVPDGGTVAFSDNGSPISTCTAQPVNTTTGTATCTVTYTAVGSHTIVATYSGDFFYQGSTSAALVQNVTYAIKVLYDQTKVNNSGASVPIKVQLADASGTNLSSASIVLTVTGLSPDPAPGVPPSGTFTFTNLTGFGPGYVFTVKTTKYPNATYTLSFTATGDPVTHTVKFVIG